MGYKLCTAEKPSVARAIASVVGADKKGDGYLYGNGYIVTWAIGHLVGLAEPNEYGYVPQKVMFNSEFRQRAYGETPLIPEDFKLVVLESTKEQFEVVKRLMHRDDVDEIIDCGDMGAEGHILQWLIREKAGCTKPVRRFCAVSMTDKALKEAMGKLRNIDEFTPIIRGELCKKKADWILGMSISRVLSLKYDSFLPVGRVVTPTLAFVVRRWIDVTKFKVTSYYTLKATSKVEREFSLYWNTDVDNIIPATEKDEDGRVIDKQIVEAKCAEVKVNGRGTVVKMDVFKKAKDRPQLYDLITLQREANRIYGYTAQLTLDITQALYETQKVMSYPRTDSRYITNDLAELMNERITAIGTIPKYAGIAGGLVDSGLNIDKKISDDSKVTDHHALIVTEKIKGLKMEDIKPTSDEAKKGVTQAGMINILNLVISRMLVSFSQPYKYEQTDLVVKMGNGMTFTARGKRDLDKGWKRIEKQLLSAKSANEEVSEDDQTLPKLSVGQVINISGCEVVPKKTTPPKLYTEDTLLSAMENAGAKLSNGAILRGKGIGTQSTRGAIIQKLHTEGYIVDEKKGKTKYLVPTPKGRNLMKVLPPELYSPKITADWETRIANIVSGKEKEADVMAAFIAFLKDKTAEVKAIEVSDVSFNDRESYGECPFCNKPVYRIERKDGNKIIARDYYCSDYKKCCWRLQSDDKGFVMRTGKPFTDTQIKRLIKSGRLVAECKNTLNNTAYKGAFTFKKVNKTINGTEKIYCNLVCEILKN